MVVPWPRRSTTTVQSAKGHYSRYAATHREGFLVPNALEMALATRLSCLTGIAIALRRGQRGTLTFSPLVLTMLLVGAKARNCALLGLAARRSCSPRVRAHPPRLSSGVACKEHEPRQQVQKKARNSTYVESRT